VLRPALTMAELANRWAPVANYQVRGGSLLKTVEVFGVSNEPIKSYIERPEVDSRFKDALETRKHIVVFGASKQGKSALISRHMKEDEFIRVNCSPSTSISDIHKSVLRQLNIEFQESTKKTKELKGSVEASLEAKVKVPFLVSAKAAGKAGAEGSAASETTYKTVDYNLGLPQDISEILRTVKFSRRIVLENFHYLTDKVQRQMAFNLRVFEDSNIRFIILGIWREKNRLTQYNGDLQDRMTEIPVEPWQESDFQKVARTGAKLLNVALEEPIAAMVENSFDSIGVFQELCKETCLAAGVFETGPKKAKLTDVDLRKAIQKKLEDYSGRHIRSIETFVEQRHKNTEEKPLYIPYYFIKLLLSADFSQIEKGMSRTELHTGIRAMHHRPDDVRPSDMTYFLHNLTATQIKKDIIPPLFDYDRSNRRLKVIDSTLYFFLRNADLATLLDELPGPN
jgi:hypothetical protein